MTEKRFTYMEQFNGFCDVYDTGKILSCMRLEYVDKTVNLLNEQHETIQVLKASNGEMEDYLARLEEENEQLKKDCTVLIYHNQEYRKENEQLQTQLSQLAQSNREGVEKVQSLAKENEELRTKNNAYLQDIEVYKEDNTHLKLENEQLKEELNKLKKFEYGGEHIRLSINIETGELQRHIYATGQWFGDFDRVLVDNWLSKEDYQRFINRVIEVYNTEFKKELQE